MLEFTNNDYKNFHITFQGDQLKITTTLNIKESMKQFLPSNRVQKSKERLVYFISSSMNFSSDVSEALILRIANMLINQAMIDCREAKKKVLSLEIANISINSQHNDLSSMRVKSKDENDYKKKES
jgi:hypothetical protein